MNFRETFRLSRAQNRALNRAEKDSVKRRETVKTAPSQPPAKGFKSKVLDVDNHDPSKQLKLKQLVARVVALAQTFAEKVFYPYQVELAYRIAESLLEHDGEVITALISRQAGKCLAKGTKVMRHNGNIVDVENVKVGDLLMGDDSTPRTVLSLARGREKMYRVQPRSGYAEPYVVNESHILSLRCRRTQKIHDISVTEYLSLTDSEKQEKFQGYKVSTDFERKSLEGVDPYWFGLWIGDGKKTDTRIYTEDKEISDYVKAYAEFLGMKVSVYDDEYGKCPAYAIVSKGPGNNPLFSALKAFGVIGDKRIPMQFLSNSRDIRLRLLAGIIDSDGHRPPTAGKENTCEVTQTKENLAQEITHLARSLGFRASYQEKKTSCQGGYEGVAYRVSIYGELWQIPTHVERKKWSKGTLRENPLTYGFDLEELPIGDYYGFELDGNKRFLLGDFTVTHNTETLSGIVAALAVILPSLARRFPEDWRLNITDEQGVYRGYRGGIKIGIYAPRQEQAEIMFNRIKLALNSDTGKEILRELGLKKTESNGDRIRLGNGTRILCQSASEQSKIEGETHHLLILEEAQDISDLKVRKSLGPMVSSLLGTVVKIGTASTKKCDFYTSIKNNERMELVNEKRNHFFYPHTVTERYNSLYRRYVGKEKVRLGEDSDEFRMAYKNEWIFERGMFVTQEMLFSRRCALTDGLFSLVHPTGLPSLFSQYSLVVGIDWGASNDSTVVTTTAVNWNAPLETGDYIALEGTRNYTCYQKHVINWMEFVGDNYESQFWAILDYLKSLKALKKVVMDSNTAGQPIFDRFASVFAGSGVEIVPFNFNARLKSDGYKSLYGDICAGRITFPACQPVRKSLVWRKFVQQMLDLRKEYVNGLMRVTHPPEKGAHDDHGDAFMLSAWGANDSQRVGEIEVDTNPFYGQRVSTFQKL